MSKGVPTKKNSGGGRKKPIVGSSLNFFSAWEGERRNEGKLRSIILLRMV